jgi:putative transposase
MRQAYQYKLLPNAEQKRQINRWLDMLRHQYNYLLADRFAWWQENRNEVRLPSGDFCQIACTLPPLELRENPNYHSQSASLPQLKKERPWYKEIYSQVLQDAVKRVQLVFDRFLKGDFKGKKSGKPRFKNQSRYRTFTYPQAKDDWIQDNKIKFPKLGLIKFVKHRCFNDGCTVKTASITKKADGYYVTLIVEDTSIPEFETDITPTEDNSIAMDCGLEKLYVDDLGNQVLPEKFFRKAQDKLAKLQRKLADDKRCKKAKRLIRQSIAKLHQKIARQRKQWHFEEAKKLCFKADVIFVEDLKIANLKRKNKPKKEDGKFVPNGQSAKSGLNKSFSDCAIAQFLEIRASS